MSNSGPSRHSGQAITPGRIPGMSFYAAPGPTNVPASVLRAVAQASTDFMGAAFAETYELCVAGLAPILGSAQPLHFYASSGHGAWEATFANLFSRGDAVLMLDSGVFSAFWAGMGEAFGLDVRLLAADWRHGVAMDALEAVLRADVGHAIRAVCVVHNDTASGVTLPAAEVRAAMDRAGHPALYLLDVISSAGSLPLHLDAWGVDAAIGSCQKGLMLLPGLAFTSVSPRAMRAHRQAQLPRAYFDWTRMSQRPHAHSTGTVSAAMFAGLREALGLIGAEGLQAVFARHARLAEATRRAIAGWGHGLELFCRVPSRASDSISAVLLPQGVTATDLRRTAFERCHVTLGGDLGQMQDRLFRIGHMGDLNEAMLLGVLGAAELSLAACHIAHGPGVAAALDWLKTPG